MGEGAPKENIFLANSDATESLGRKISPNLRPGDIVKITGSLGAGKTTLVRGIVSGLGGEASQVHSPTFALVHEYGTPIAIVNHCDFYRLPVGSDMGEFGEAEFFEADKIYLVEWADQICLPEFEAGRRVWEVKIESEGDGRKIQLPTMWQIVD